MRSVLWLLLSLALLLGLPLDALAAHAQSTPSFIYFSVSGRRCLVASYTETDVGTATDAVVTLPAGWVSSVAGSQGVQGFIVAYKATLTGGSAATIHTVFGRVAAFTVSTQSWFGTADATAAHINEPGPMTFNAPLGKIYIRPVPNTGSNNAVETEVIVCEGMP